jgi:hypothetical protein
LESTDFVEHRSPEGNGRSEAGFCQAGCHTGNDTGEKMVIDAHRRELGPNIVQRPASITAGHGADIGLFFACITVMFALSTAMAGCFVETVRDPGPVVVQSSGRLILRWTVDEGLDPNVPFLGKPSHAREVIRVRMRVEDIDQTDVTRAQCLDKSVDLIQTGIDCHRRTAGGVHHQVAEATTIRGPEGFDSHCRVDDVDRRHSRFLR